MLHNFFHLSCKIQIFDYYYYHYYSGIFTSAFHKILIDNNFPQVSRTLHSILADLYNSCVGWIVSIRPLISNSSSPHSKALGTIPRALSDITVDLIFHNFLSSRARSKYLPLLFWFCLIFALWSAETARTTTQQVIFFILLIITRSGILAGIRGSSLYLKIPLNFIYLIN